MVVEHIRHRNAANGAAESACRVLHGSASSDTSQWENGSLTCPEPLAVVVEEEAVYCKANFRCKSRILLTLFVLLVHPLEHLSTGMEKVSVQGSHRALAKRQGLRFLSERVAINLKRWTLAYLCERQVRKSPHLITTAHEYVNRLLRVLLEQVIPEWIGSLHCKSHG